MSGVIASLTGKKITQAVKERDQDGELKAVEFHFDDGSSFRVNAACMYCEENYPIGYLALSYLGARNDG